MTTVISWLFLLYFVVLFFERTQSIVRIGFSNLCKTGFDSYVNILAIVSLLATVVLLIIKNKDFWLSLVKTNVTPDYSWLAITAGVILISGMLHTENTIAPIQFGAYGLLIVAMVLRVIQNTKGLANPFTSWYSLAFVVVFSMAIPVVYNSKIKNAALFYVIEAIVSLALVLYFTLFLYNIMTGNGANLLWWVPTIIVAIGDTLILALKWKESVNSFVLIFGSLTLVLFIIGKIIFTVTNR